MSIHVTEIPHAIASIPELEAEQRHTLLETERRRIALAILMSEEGTIALDEMASAVVALEDGEGANEGTADRVASMLHHVDLPILESIGVIRYDATQRVVHSNGFSI